MAVCPVRRQCPRFQATGYSRSRAVHDQGPRGYPVSEVEPMVRSETLLTTIVTLSLGRPHGSCKEARPEGLAGTESPDTRVLNPTHVQETITTGKRRRRGQKEREVRGKEGTKSNSMTGLNRCGKRIQSLFEGEDKRVNVINSSGFEFDLPDVVARELGTSGF